MYCSFDRQYIFEKMYCNYKVYILVQILLFGLVFIPLWKPHYYALPYSYRDDKLSAPWSIKETGNEQINKQITGENKNMLCYREGWKKKSFMLGVQGRNLQESEI